MCSIGPGSSALPTSTPAVAAAIAAPAVAPAGSTPPTPPFDPSVPAAASHCGGVVDTVPGYNQLQEAFDRQYNVQLDALPQQGVNNLQSIPAQPGTSSLQEAFNRQYNVSLTPIQGGKPGVGPGQLPVPVGTPSIDPAALKARLATLSPTDRAAALVDVRQRLAIRQARLDEISKAIATDANATGTVSPIALQRLEVENNASLAIAVAAFGDDASALRPYQDHHAAIKARMLSLVQPN